MKAVKIIAVLVVIAVAIGIIACPVVNDFTAKDIESELNSIPVPTGTTYVKSISASGKVRKNATVVQYYGAVLVQSTLSEDGLAQYYKQKDPNVFLISQEKGKTVLADIDKDLRFGEYDENSTKNSYFILYKWGSGKEPFNLFDYRVMFG